MEINNVIAIALDLDNDKIDWYKNGDSHEANSIKPSELEGSRIFPVVLSGTAQNIAFEANFGASDFIYPIPEGFYLFKIQAHLKHLIRRIQMRPLIQLVTVQF
ncbi:hypothetical protein [Paenibacillus polymyxa]|uniref:hypothetical protein n=1 Tax=Paenibacillus polymyxa TaxID=1406 RepID=UPI002B411814|nr:hypothetical protein [Paenibacillus polymyxa]